MVQQKTLFFVGAHPDDETFGIGGTLAQYSAAGVKTYYICATRGEVGEADPEFMKDYASVGDMRWGELKCAAKILGLVDVIHLGYRDSGMPGSPDNKHPQALAAAPVDQVAGRLVKIIRELKPQVVVTHDPIGGYRHPDHIAIYNATVKAFAAAGDPSQFPEAGPAFKPQKLYYALFPRGVLKIVVKLMPLFGKNPHKFGVNQDIDLAGVANVNYPVHAAIRVSHLSAETRDEAVSCHASQLGGGGGRRRPLVFRIVGLFNGDRDLFMRAYPPVVKKLREKDLFEGVV